MKDKHSIHGSQIPKQKIIPPMPTIIPNKEESDKTTDKKTLDKSEPLVLK